jgi:hypothetical protein
MKMNETINGVKEAVTGLMPYLEKAAEKLGTTAQYLWALQLKQAYVLFWTNIVYIILTCFGWFIFYKGAKKLTKTQDKDLVMGLFIFLVSLGIALTASTLVHLSSINEYMTMLFNPEYWALSEVVKLLRGGK